MPRGSCQLLAERASPLVRSTPAQAFSYPHRVRPTGLVLTARNSEPSTN
jgi:hypothetical protein